MRISDNHPSLNRQQSTNTITDLSNATTANEINQVSINDASLNVRSVGAPLLDQSIGYQKGTTNSVANATYSLPEDIALRIAHTLGIDPTPENIQLIEKHGFSTADTFAKLIKMIQTVENQQVLEEMGMSLLSFEDLPQYLKGFNEDSLSSILRRLNTAIEKALQALDKSSAKLDKQLPVLDKQLSVVERAFSTFESGSSTARELIQLCNDLTKGLTMQLQHPFPFLFIPFIIVDNGKPQAGEAWVKKDGQCVYLWLDTDNLGSISIYFKDSEKGLAIEFTGSPDTVALLRKNKSKLIKALQSRQIRLHTLTFNAYSDEGKPVSILARHLSIKLPIDLGV